MGFLGSIIKKIIAEGQERTFTPDFRKSEYDNYLEYMSLGGTTESWERAKQVNNWVFKESEIEKYQRYQKEVEAVADKYFSLMVEIQKNWSVLYNLQDYTGNLARKFENMCFDDITYYKEMRSIDAKYGEKTPLNVPAFTRLAMLYEKQGKIEESVSICREAIKLGMDEKARLIRMIKKAGRTPTAEELSLLDN